MKRSVRIAIGLAFLALAASWAGKVMFVPHVPARLNGNDVPLDFSRVYGVEFCPLDWGNVLEAVCDSIGTTGPVKEISFASELKGLFGGPVAEATLRFDEHGQLVEECHRGHIDFQGSSCGAGWTPAGKRDLLFKPWGVELDDRGRFARSRNFMGGPAAMLDCEYADSGSSATSVCHDGADVLTYSYSGNGRRISFSRRRIPQPSDDPTRAVELDRAYSFVGKYVYSDDERGNWVRVRVITMSGDGFQSDHSVERKITYY